MELKNIIFTLFFLMAVGFFIWSCRNLIKYMLVAKKKDDRFDKIGLRLKRVWNIAFAQTKLLRDPAPGILHLFIFWGFILFLFAVVEALVQGFYSPFSLSFLGPIYSILTIVQDVFAVLVLIACLFALYRRYVVKVPRLDYGRHAKLDATFILILIMFVCISMLGENSALIAKHNFVLGGYEIRPISAFLSPLLYNPGSNAASFNYQLFWWMHVVVVLGFMNFLPYSKHLHVITSIPNTFFANLESC